VFCGSVFSLSISRPLGATDILKTPLHPPPKADTTNPRLSHSVFQFSHFPSLFSEQPRTALESIHSPTSPQDRHETPRRGSAADALEFCFRSYILQIPAFCGGGSLCGGLQDLPAAFSLLDQRPAKDLKLLCGTPQHVCRNPAGVSSSRGLLCSS
jgi:hypothetical protein